MFQARRQRPEEDLMKKITAVITLLFALVLSACTSEAQPNSGVPGTGQDSGSAIQIGSKDFTESFIVAEMYAQLLENAGFTVQRRLNLGGTPVAHEAILRGDIDLYPEYTSTGLLTVLKLAPLQDTQQIISTLRSQYEEQFGLTWLEPAPFNNTQALAMTRAGSEAYGIRTFSDLADRAPDLVLGGPAEFFEREDGIRALQTEYGGFQFKELRQLGTGSLRYQALLDGQIDVVVAFGTDGQIQGYDLVRLEDDRGVYPIYQIAPVVRRDVLEQSPEIADVLNRLAPLLVDEVMSGLNWQVDGPDKREYADVAREFLQQNGLLP
jgi:osmoprotectant transport system substrate-binding protein